MTNRRWARCDRRRIGLRAVLGAGVLGVGMLLLAGCGSEVVSLGGTGSQAGPPPTASQSGTVTVAPEYAATGQGGSVQFTAAVTGGGTGSGGLQWTVNGVAGGNALLGTVDEQGRYTAPAALTASENVTVTAQVMSSPGTNYATSVVSLIEPGVVTATGNPQVASYAMDLPAPGTVEVVFGPTAGYGLRTWTRPTATANGGTVSLYVAGMLGQTMYHMQARVVLKDGATYSDQDQTFMTGTPQYSSPVTAETTVGDTPQPGIEMFDTLSPLEPVQAFATDLNGNVIWTYTYQGNADDRVQPIEMLANGDFLVQISYASSIPLQKGNAIPPGVLDEVREVDLAGNMVRSLTAAQVESELAAEGYNLKLGSLHHDVLALPNGHLLLLFTVTEDVAVNGYPGLTSVLGDALVDVDQNFKPDWVWNSFDHLDVNRHPYLFPDWTHSNALLYTDDHNVLLSVRHQNWIIKIDFEDGKGPGNVMWRLGEGGDFRLVGGTDPTDWFYAQHGPSFFSANSSGVFELGVMDNGDDREFPSGVTCGVAGGPACTYSAVDVLQVDETKMTATLEEHYLPAGQLYSFFGGSVSPLANGDLDADFCGVGTGSVVQELNGAEQVVWQAETKGADQYRTERLGSLYPGVQW